MLDVGLHSVKDSLANGLIKISLVYPMSKKYHFRLLEPLSITLSDGGVIVIPSDFLFDGSSSPRFLWWLFPSYGDFFVAALIHDYMYQTQYKAFELGYSYAQKYADKEMLIWSNLLNDRNFGNIVDNYMRYYAVRIFGKKVYLK